MKKAKLIKKYDKLLLDYCDLAGMFDYMEQEYKELQMEINELQENNKLKNMVTDLLSSIIGEK